MPKRTEISTRIKRMSKMSVDKKRQYVTVLLVMGFALSIVFASGYMPFATFYLGGDFTATMGIEGLYLPDSPTIETYYANDASTDVFDEEIDGNPQMVSFGAEAYLYTWPDGTRAYWTETVDTSSSSYDPALDIYEDGAGGYDRWGDEGYIHDSWYPNLDGYYTLLPDIKGGLDNIRHIDWGSTPTSLKVLAAGVPSADGTTTEGYYVEEYYYVFDLTVKIHADIDESSTGVTYIDYGGVTTAIFTPMEMASFKNIFFTFGLATSAINQSITGFGTEMQGFGAHEIQFYEHGTDTPVGTSYVHSALDNIPGAVPLTLRTTEIDFNRNYLMTGTDPTGPLVPTDSTIIPYLSDVGMDYFLFSIDRIAAPAYYYIDTGLAGPTEYYGIFDLEVTFPLMTTVIVYYDILTGETPGLNGNTNGTLIVDGDDDNGNVYSLGTLGTFDMSFITAPIVIVCVIGLLIVKRR